MTIVNPFPGFVITTDPGYDNSKSIPGVRGQIRFFACSRELCIVLRVQIDYIWLVESKSAIILKNFATNPGNDKSKSISGVRGHHEPRKRIHHRPWKRIYYSHFQGLDIWDWIFPHSDFTNKFSFPTWECPFITQRLLFEQTWVWVQGCNGLLNADPRGNGIAIPMLERKTY